MTNRLDNRKRPLPPLADLLAEARRIYAYSEEAKGLVWCGFTDSRRRWPALGSIVGGNDGHGYRMCLILGHKFKVHQVVWLLAHGELPTLPVDHVNNIRMDNRISNLRLATDQQNAQNRKRDNGGRLSGVKRHKTTHRVGAVVVHNGKQHYLGHFDTEEEAHAAYVEGKRQICGDFSPI